MSTNDVTVVLAHGAWADGSSWAKVIEGLKWQGIRSIAAALPLTSRPDDLAAIDQANRTSTTAAAPQRARSGFQGGWLH